MSTSSKSTKVQEQERKRDHPESENSSPSSSPLSALVNLFPRPTKKTKQDDVIDAIAELHMLLEQQQKEIAVLRSTVEKQESHIELLSSLIGVNKLPEPGSSVDVFEQSSNSTQLKPSYASVVAKSGTVLNKTFKNVVVSAVYRDLSDKERRARNVVVNGLPPSADDKAAFYNIIDTEFNKQPNIIRCRRLGKPQPGRIQPLLVVLSDSTIAGFLVDNAKQLRNSSNELVKKSVYINADITQAEALAAYQIRRERRERAARTTNGPEKQSQPQSLPQHQTTASLLTTAAAFIPSSSQFTVNDTSTSSMDVGATCNAD
jgi:hypothetical protein